VTEEPAQQFHSPKEKVVVPAGSGVSNVSDVAPIQDLTGTTPLSDGLEVVEADNRICMLYAFNKTVGFDALTANDLNQEMKEVYKEQNKQEEWTPNKFLPEWAGEEDLTWHLECIPKALKRMYEGGYEYRLQRGNQDIIFEKGKGKFFVWGEKNRLLWPSEDQSGSWQHTICVDTDKGLFYEGDHPRGKSVRKYLAHPL
jgi:hypothetical protein